MYQTVMVFPPFFLVLRFSTDLILLVYIFGFQMLAFGTVVFFVFLCFAFEQSCLHVYNSFCSVFLSATKGMTYFAVCGMAHKFMCGLLEINKFKDILLLLLRRSLIIELMYLEADVIHSGTLVT